MRPWREAVLGFTVAAAYWPSILSGAFAPRWAAIAILVPLLFRVEIRSLPESFRWLLLFMVAASGLSLVQAGDVLSGIYDFFFVLILAVVLVVGAGGLRLDAVFVGMAAGLALSSAIVLVQLGGFQPVVNLSGLPSGLFYNSEVLAEFAALILVWGALRRRWGIVAVALVPVLACQSRVAVLAAVAALLWAWMPRRFVLGAVVTAGLVLAGIAAAFLISDYKLGTAVHRIGLWLSAWYGLEFFGRGLGWYAVNFPGVRYVHSDALQMLLEIGVAALALLYIPYVIFRERLGHVAERAVFLAVCIEAVVAFPLHMPATAFVAAVLAGHLLGLRDLVRDGHAGRRIEDCGDLQRPAAAGSGFASPRGSGRGAVSLRPLLARGDRQCARKDFNPAGAEA